MMKRIPKVLTGFLAFLLVCSAQGIAKTTAPEAEETCTALMEEADIPLSDTDPEAEESEGIPAEPLPEEIPDETLSEQESSLPEEATDSAPAEEMAKDIPELEAVPADAPAELLPEEIPDEILSEEKSFLPEEATDSAPIEEVAEGIPELEEIPAEAVPADALAELLPEEAPGEPLPEKEASLTEEAADSVPAEEMADEIPELEEAPAEAVPADAPAELLPEEIPEENLSETDASLTEETPDSVPAEEVAEEIPEPEDIPAEVILADAPAELLPEEIPDEILSEEESFLPEEAPDSAPAEEVAEGIPEPEEIPAEAVPADAPAELLPEEIPNEILSEEESSFPGETPDSAPAEEEAKEITELEEAPAGEVPAVLSGVEETSSEEVPEQIPEIEEAPAGEVPEEEVPEEIPETEAIPAEEVSEEEAVPASGQITLPETAIILVSECTPPTDQLPAECTSPTDPPPAEAVPALSEDPASFPEPGAISEEPIVVSPEALPEDPALLTEGSAFPTEASLTSLNEGSPEQNHAVSILDLRLSPVASNPVYSQLSFDFEDTASRRTFHCLITGLQLEEGGSSEGANQLACDVAQSFLSGQPLHLSEERLSVRYGINTDLIDAEKQNILSGEDTKQCWAASAANMIEFAGWNVFPSEDEAYRAMSESFNNLGGTQQMALDWYMNGINPFQQVSSEGEVQYTDTSSGAAQQLKADTGNYRPDYAFSASASVGKAYTEIDRQLEDGVKQLENGSAMGIGVYTYTGNSYSGQGHSLTVFGYISELLAQAARQISALFISDSDNDAAGQTVAPEERMDTYSMYLLQDYSNGRIESRELSGYKYAEDTHTVIGTVTSLQPFSAAVAEQQGTMDAAGSVNLVPSALEVQDSGGKELSQASAGDSLTLPVEITNQSYTALPEGAEAEITLHVEREGVSMEDRKMTVPLENIPPLGSVISSFSFEAEDPGEYAFRAEITGLRDTSGNSLAEAYSSDNSLPEARRISVASRESGEEPLPAPEPGGEGTFPFSPSGSSEENVPAPGLPEKIYRLVAEPGREESCTLECISPFRRLEDFLRIQHRKSGQVLSGESFRLVLQKEKLLLTFTDSFLRSLDPGEHDFELLFQGGRMLIRIVLL